MSAVRASNQLTGLIRAMRPRQWVKNVLVVTAPIAAAKITDLAVLRGVAISFVVFCLAASSIYLLNDILDIEADRAHPRKRNRPIAAGLVSKPLAAAASAVLAVAALGLSFLATPQLAIVMAVYLIIQVAYCLKLKHEPVLDIAVVSSGFLLRAIAGGAATDIVLSQWFLLTAAFGSLFMAAGKRYAEKLLAENGAKEIRPVLERYTSTYLRFVWTLSATAVVVTYSLWSFEIYNRTGSIWAPISIIAFVLAILRYGVDVDGGRADAPEDIVIGDRQLQLIGVLWAICLALSIYL